MTKITVTLHGQDVQADLLNPEVTERFENGFAAVLEEFNSVAANKEIAGSKGIRLQCQAVIDYVTDIFGADGAKKVFGEETDLLTCLDILGEMTDLYPTQVIPKIREKKSVFEKKLAERRKLVTPDEV